MSLSRALKHLLVPHWIATRAFPRPVLKRIEQGIADSEKQHRGELRFVVEAGLHLHDLMRDRDARTRAEEVFSQLRVWDTEENSGVLIYVQLVDRRIEIVADRGISGKVAQPEWVAICRAMESSFKEKQYTDGALHGIACVTALLARHFPSRGIHPNELPDKPLVL